MPNNILSAAKKSILSGQLKAIQNFLDEENITDMTADDIRNVLRETQDLPKVLRTVCSKVGPRLSSDQAFGAFIDLVGKLWNSLPSKERGADPGVDAYEPGPIEAALTMEYMQFIQFSVDPTTCRTQKEIDEKVEAASEEWLNARQQRLQGRTPNEAVAKERRDAGRTDLEWSIRLHIHAV
ncbi:MAG: hypothetical protein AAB853_02150 [Patescibacteria group bacterium]|mgnify:CR=1 FL=1